MSATVTGSTTACRTSRIISYAPPACPSIRNPETAISCQTVATRTNHSSCQASRVRGGLTDEISRLKRKSGNVRFGYKLLSAHSVPEPSPMPLPVETDSHILIPPLMTFACPEALPGSVQTCGQCPMGLLCDGFGSCVQPENCPCVKDGKAFPIGGRIESTTCQECMCQIGGHSMCAPMMCPLCPVSAALVRVDGFRKI